MNESYHTCEWGMSFTWMIHVTRMNASRHTHKRNITHTSSRASTLLHFLSYIRMSHVTRMNASVMAHVWIRHVNTHEWIMPRIWMCHVTRTCQSLHTYAYVNSHISMGHATPYPHWTRHFFFLMGRAIPMRVSRTITNIASPTHDFAYVNEFSFNFVCVAWRIHICDMWHDASIRVTWLIHMCDTWHDSLICVTRLIHMCEVVFHIYRATYTNASCHVWTNHALQKRTHITNKYDIWMIHAIYKWKKSKDMIDSFTPYYILDVRHVR